MLRSIGKWLAFAAIILGCGVSEVCFPAFGGEPPNAGITQLDALPIEFVNIPGPPPPLLPPPSENERKILRDIRAGWETRHQRIHSLYIACNFRPGDCTNPNVGPPNRHERLWIDGDLRKRLETSLPSTAKPRVYAFDGMTARVWYPDRFLGTMDNGEPEFDELCGFSPIWLLAVDPLRCNAIDISWPDARFLTKNAVIGDRHCVKVRFRMKVCDMVDTLWIDPARDNVVVAWERGIPDWKAAFVSIDYSFDKQHGWLPTRWHRTMREWYDWSAMADAIKVNEQYSIEKFRLTFPPGAEVDDRRISQRFVIAADGSKTHVRSRLELETIDDSLNLLNRQTDFIIDPEPLKDALAFIGQRYHIKTAFDERAVRQGLIDPAVQVQTEKHGIKLKELLDLLLKQSPKPARYEIRNNVVTVVADPASRDVHK